MYQNYAKLFEAGIVNGTEGLMTSSSHDGGTGTAAWRCVKGWGLPWELELAETKQTLVLNGLRNCVKLQTEVQLKTGRVVAIVANTPSITMP